jgi:hypothetical protein
MWDVWDFTKKTSLRVEDRSGASSNKKIESPWREVSAPPTQLQVGASREGESTAESFGTVHFGSVFIDSANARTAHSVSQFRAVGADGAEKHFLATSIVSLDPTTLIGK